MGLADVIAEGGCYWPKKEGSPGHSFVVPNGTRFKIALEGPTGHVFCAGECTGCYYVAESGEKFVSANEAVNSIRESSTNAFLYVQFQIYNQWISAGRLREMPDTVLDEAEEAAIQSGKEMARLLRDRKNIEADDARLTRWAARYVQQNPELVHQARDRIALLQSIQLDDL